MFFRPKAARWLIDSGHKGLNLFLNAAEEAGSKNVDRDAAIMFAGFIHFAIAFYMANGKIKSDDIAPILAACALHIRHYAPNHSLGVSYLEDTRDMVMRAVQSTDQDPVRWISEYRLLAKDLISIDEVAFCAALSAYVFYAFDSWSQSS